MISYIKSQEWKRYFHGPVWHKKKKKKKLGIVSKEKFNCKNKVFDLAYA